MDSLTAIVFSKKKQLELERERSLFDPRLQYLFFLDAKIRDIFSMFRYYVKGERCLLLIIYNKFDYSM